MAWKIDGITSKKAHAFMISNVSPEVKNWCDFYTYQTIQLTFFFFFFWNLKENDCKKFAEIQRFTVVLLLKKKIPNIADLRLRSRSNVVRASRVQVPRMKIIGMKWLKGCGLWGSGATLIFLCAYLFHIINSRESIEKPKHLPFRVHFILFEVHTVLQKWEQGQSTTLPRPLILS